MKEQQKPGGKLVFKPGQSGNPNGRPAGVSNKVTSEMRGKVNTILEYNWETIQADIDTLEPKDRLIFMEKLLSYVLPKMQLVKGEFDVRNQTGAEGLSSTELTDFILQVIPQNAE